MNERTLLKDTVATMERFNFNKPVHVEIIFEDDDDDEITDEIDVVNLDDQDQSQDNTLPIEHSDETEASDTFRTSLNNNEEGMLDVVSQNMSYIVEAYINYSYQFHKANGKVVNNFKSIYLKTKYYFFRQSFPMSILLLRPEYRSEHFIKNYLKEVIKKTNVKPDNVIYDCLRFIYNDLLRWTEIKLGRKSSAPQEIHKLYYARLPSEYSLDLNNNNQTNKEQMFMNHERLSINLNSSNSIENLNADVELISDENQMFPSVSYDFNYVLNSTNQRKVQTTKLGYSTSVNSKLDNAENCQQNETTNYHSQVNIETSNNNQHNGPVVEYNNSPPLLSHLIYLTNNEQKSAQINNSNMQNTSSNEIENKTETYVDPQESQNLILRNSDYTEQIVENSSVETASSTQQMFFALISHDVLKADDADVMPLGSCHVCEKETNLICIACYKIYYCSGNCQSADWDSHESTCF